MKKLMFAFMFVIGCNNDVETPSEASAWEWVDQWGWTEVAEITCTESSLSGDLCIVNLSLDGETIALTYVLQCDETKCNMIESY